MYTYIGTLGVLKKYIPSSEVLILQQLIPPWSSCYFLYSDLSTIHLTRGLFLFSSGKQMASVYLVGVSFQIII